MANKIIAVSNQKGGVGKTTSAVSLAAAFAAEGKKTLLIDMDPQCNATVACGVAHREIEFGVMEVLTGDKAPEDVCLHLPDSGIWLLPANENLSADDKDLAAQAARHSALQRHCTGWIEGFDWVFIDCPPTLNILTVNALVAAQYVLVPIQCEYFALEGVGALLDTVGQVRQSINPDLRVAGFLRTMFDPRSRLTREVSDNLIEHLNGLVFNEIIPRNVRLAEAPSYGQPIVQYDPRSKGALAYQAVAQELAQRLGN